MWSKIMYQGQGSSEVKLDGKCKIAIYFLFLFYLFIFFFFEKLKSNYNQTWFVDATCEPLTLWVGGAKSNLVS